MSKDSKLGFRPARVNNEIQTAISQQETTRLNVEISKELATKLKLRAVQEHTTLKGLVTAALELIIK
jgi:hypothetical protein